MALFMEVAKEHKKHEGETILPEISTTGSCGGDIRLKEDLIVPAMGISELSWTDVKVICGENRFVMLAPRSSIGNRGLMLVNTVGIIDRDYAFNDGNDGNMGVRFFNFTNEDILLEKCERVVQAIELPYIPHTTWEEQRVWMGGLTDDKMIDLLKGSVKGTRKGGFGSTGKK